MISGTPPNTSAAVPLDRRAALSLWSPLGDGSWRLLLDDGTTEDADLVVGADGTWSRIRPAALFALVPCMAITGGTGRSLGAIRRRAPLIRRKQRRISAAAAIGLLVLVPCAVTLHVLASDRHFGTEFSVIQAVEFLGGAVNITLLSLNVRDGRLLTAVARRRRNTPASVAAQL
ncbi:hypothetical protein ACWGI9_40690 [Streptomyces sp. NPDC054833]